LRVHIDRIIWHLDVGLSHPKAEGGFKGWAVRPLTAVHELGLDRCETGRSLSTVNKISLSRKLTVVREDPVR